MLTLCEKAGLAQFAKIVLTVCYHWYGVGTPYVDDTADCESFLVSYGAFGNADRNKSAVIARRQMEQGEKASPCAASCAWRFRHTAKCAAYPIFDF